MKLSIIIPARNEQKTIKNTLIKLYNVLSKEGIPHEILVVDDYSTDNTEETVISEKQNITSLKYFKNKRPQGFGSAVRFGFEKISGDCVAIIMADGSDSPEDLLSFYREMMKTGCDAVFGSRFIKGGETKNYPIPKLILNRIVNNLIRIVFGIKYNDITNAFKLYRKETIEGLKPLLSPHFNLTVELPLKVIIRGYSYSSLANSWTNRKHGESKLKIKEMGSRYLFIILYCLIEKYFSKGDYRK